MLSRRWVSSVWLHTTETPGYWAPLIHCPLPDIVLPMGIERPRKQRMMDKALKAQIRAELFRCAVAGELLTYRQFFNRIRPGATMGNFPYQAHFDEIAKEERTNGYPDITFIVHRSGGIASISRPNRFSAGKSARPESTEWLA